MRRLILLGIAIAVLVVPLPQARGQAPYYAGKTIELVVPFATGGGTDIESRFFAPFFERHIPGNPRFIVRNAPGGGSVLGANAFAATAKPDGLTLLASSGSTVIPFILQVPQVRYDFRKWKLIKVNGVGGVIYVSPRIGVKKAEDLLKPTERLIYGGISATALDLVMLLTFEVLGLDVKSVLGFEGRGPARLAFERGEVNIDYQTTPAYLSQVAPLVKEGKAVPVMTMGFVNERGQLVRDPGLKDLPTIYEVYEQINKRKPDGLLRWKAYAALIGPGFSYQKTIWAPEGTPQEALEPLLSAIDRMNRDFQFKDQGRAVLEGYSVARGDKVEPAVHRSMRVTLDVIKYIKDLVRTKYNVSI